MNTSRYQRNTLTIGGAADLDSTAKQDGYLVGWDESNSVHKYIAPGGLDPVTEGRIDNLETRYARITRFETIGTNTSGTLTIPTNETVVLDDFGGTKDAIVTTLVSGKPDWSPVIDTNGSLVTTSFDTNGAFVLSAVAATTNNCIVFRTEVEAKNLVYDAGVIGPYSMDPAHTQLSLLNGDSNYQHLSLAEKTRATGINDQIRGPTGFLAQDTVGMSYDSSTLKLTITGTDGAVFKGVAVPTIVNGWESSAHSTNDGLYCHYFDGTNYVWSTNGFASFDNIMIACVYKDATVSIGLKETHGCTMDSDDHRNQHYGVGTQKQAGGTLSQVVVNSYTAAARRPYVSETKILDEDLAVTLSALATNSYTQVSLSGTVSGTNEGTLTWALASADVVNLTTTRPNVNILTSGTGVLTPMTAGQFMSVWLIAVQVTDDANSQQFRYIWVQGQNQTTTAAAQTSIDPRTLDTRKLSRALPEYVFIQQVVLEYVGGGTANWRINTTRTISGSRVNQISVSGTAGLSVVSSDSNYFTGLGTPADPLSLVAPLATEKTTPIDADSVGISDSADGGILKKLTWANLKATLLATVMTWTSKQTFDGGAAIKGATSAAAAGYVGEEIISTVARAGAAVCTSGQWRDITSISVTAGVWFISGTVCGVGSSTAAIIEGGVGTTTGNSGAGIPDGDGTVYGVYNLNIVDTHGALGARRIVVASTTTYYLKIYYSGTGTCSGYGTIKAERFA
jgi:hypothetical protein